METDSTILIQWSRLAISNLMIFKFLFSNSFSILRRDVDEVVDLVQLHCYNLIMYEYIIEWIRFSCKDTVGSDLGPPDLGQIAVVWEDIVAGRRENWRTEFSGTTARCDVLKFSCIQLIISRNDFFEPKFEFFLVRPNQNLDFDFALI